MKKFALIILVLYFANSIFAIIQNEKSLKSYFYYRNNKPIYNISWNTPDIYSLNSYSFLEKYIYEFIPYTIRFKEHELDFALSSWSSFRESIKKFLFDNDDSSTFLYYKTPSQKKPLPHGASVSIANIPLDSSLSINLLTGCDFVKSEKESYYFVYYGSKVSGYFEKKLYFYCYWWAGHFGGDTDFAKKSKLIDSWTQDSSDSDQIHLDNISGRISYRARFWSLSVGRGKYEIGNNIGGSIILNDDCNDYGYFSNKFDFKNLSISFLHATLIPDSTSANSGDDSYYYKHYEDKYLVVHKIEWQPSRAFKLFFGEEVIYGGRSIDPSYILPHTFWRATEHNLGDRDNVMIFTGFLWKPINKNYLYLNFVFDELKKSEIFGDWWGNKYAVQIGNSYFFNEEKDTKLTFEFTALRPWIYTHKIIYDKFSHDDIGLGFPEGSNLIQYSGEFNYNIRNNLNLNIHSSFTRQGSVGNNFSINYETRDETLDNNTHWLEGDITDKVSICPVITWQPLSHHKLKLGMNISKIDDEAFEKEVMISYQAIY